VPLTARSLDRPVNAMITPTPIDEFSPEQVYLRQAGEWIMIAVSGRPDVQETRVGNTQMKESV
jgi:hypothetical protein